MEVSFVDLGKRPAAPAELRRFSQRLGATALLDEAAQAYTSAGLGYMRMDDAEIIQRLADDPRLLRLPLVRHGDELTVGVDEERWREWQRCL
jgi:arsenate reductase-like glutaredoxin family protein